MMIEADILKALQTAAIAAYAASPLCAAPYNWPSDGKGRIKPAGITFNPSDADARWIEFINIVNNRDNDYWDDGRVYQGNFRIILHWPPDEAGAYVPMRIMDDLVGRFPKGVLLREGNAVVQIYGVPLASGVIENGSELLLPVALPYRCWKA